MLKRFRSGNSSKKATPSVAAERPRLELSGPLLREALDSMIGVCDAGGGAERYVQALIFKSSIFKDAFSPASGPMTLQRFLRLCMFLPTVRRKAHVYFTSERCDEILTALPVLLDDKVGFPERLRVLSLSFLTTKRTDGPAISAPKFCTISIQNDAQQ